MAEEKPLLLLFDGHALVHRAFHALPPLSVTKTGEMVSAVYGFTLMLLKVINELSPTYQAVAFDHPGPTFRHLKFEAYKAQRPKAPDELINQLTRVRELVTAFNIPLFEVESYEADDILGTLCQQAASQGIDTIIITGDTDTIQLVSPHVRVLMPQRRRGFTHTVVYDEATVRQRWGVAPHQTVDIKGLKGDPSDNIPGVPGIGEKTAVKLIQKFGSMENIYARIEEVAPCRIQQILRVNEELARQSKELVTIVTNVPVSLDLTACHVAAYDKERVVKLFRELEFSSLVGRLPELKPEVEKMEIAPAKAGIAATECHIITTLEALDELVAELSATKAFVIDLETTHRVAMWAKLVGIALSTRSGKACYVPVGHELDGQLPLPQVIDRLKPVLEDSSIAKIAHNGKYDLTVLARYGVELRNLSFDTMIAAYLLGRKALGLKALALNELGIEMTPITSLIGSGAKQITMADVSIAQAADYAAADADITGRLKEKLEPELRQQDLWRLFIEVEMPLVPVLIRMEQSGVALDTDLLRQISQDLGRQVKEVENEIYNAVGHEFNINSPKQLGSVLFDELKLRHARRTKTGYSTDAAVLEGLKGSHPIIELLLEYRQLVKLKSTYVDALPALINPETGRVHTGFNQTVTATGRLSSSDPNLQNIPIRTELGRQVRQAFVAEGGWLLLAADYSQVELRILADLSQDPGLLSAFARDEDIHAATASEVFGVNIDEVTPDMRRVAKTVNFGVAYGMSDYGLEQATELSRQEAAQFISAYFDRYSGVKNYIEATKSQAKEKGYVQTLLGRRRYIPEIHSPNHQVRSAAERMAINMPVQGTAADIIKLAMINLQQRMDDLELRSKMILQVHDELVFEVPEEEQELMKELVRENMSQAFKLSVPLEVEVKVGKNWNEME